MTPNEALHEISTKVFRNTDDFEMRISKDCYKAIRNALEKQIPKKPVKKNPICYAKTKDGQELYAYDYHCPMCDTKLKTNEHHCPCGQALDWGETE